MRMEDMTLVRNEQGMDEWVVEGERTSMLI